MDAFEEAIYQHGPLDDEPQPPISEIVEIGQSNLPAEELPDDETKADDEQQNSKLLDAASDGTLDLVNSLILGGADVCAKRANGETALHLAARYGHDDVVKSLLESQSEINTRDNDGWTPLYSAVYAGKSSVVELLINHKPPADPNISDSDGATPLHLAAPKGKPDLVELLLKSKNPAPDLDLRDDHSRTALELVDTESDLDTFYLILDHMSPKQIDSPGADNFTHLSSAACEGREGIVLKLLEKGADINSLDGDGWSPLQVASYFGKIDIVRTLLKHEPKLEIDSKDPKGETALLKASAQNHKDIVDLLIYYKAKIDIPADTGYVALHAAAEDGYLDIVKSLLGSGASAAVQDCDEWTPLHRACHSGQHEVVRTILNHSVKKDAPVQQSDVGDRDPGVFDAPHVAAETETRAVDLLKQTTKDGDSPLHLAASACREKVAKIILEELENLGEKSFMKARNSKNETAWSLALENEDAYTVGRFLEHKESIIIKNADATETVRWAAEHKETHELVILVLKKKKLMTRRVDTKIRHNFSESDWAALHWAVYHGDLDLVWRLVKSGGSDAEAESAIKHERAIANAEAMVEVIRRDIEAGLKGSAKKVGKETNLEGLSEPRRRGDGVRTDPLQETTRIAAAVRPVEERTRKEQLAEKDRSALVDEETRYSEILQMLRYSPIESSPAIVETSMRDKKYEKPLLREEVSNEAVIDMFKAGIIDFYKKEKDKRSGFLPRVHDIRTVIYKLGPDKIMDDARKLTTDFDKDDLQLRWIHLPANNVSAYSSRS